MNLKNFTEQNEIIRLVSLDSRYHGGYESHSSISRIERLEIILFPDGSFTLTHGRNDSNGPIPQKKSGRWGMDCSDSASCNLLLKYSDGSLRKMNIGESDNTFVFLDKRRFRVENLKPQELGFTNKSTA